MERLLKRLEHKKNDFGELRGYEDWDYNFIKQVLKLKDDFYNEGFEENDKFPRANFGIVIDKKGIRRERVN